MGSFITVSTPIETAGRLRKALLAFLVRLKGAMVNNCGDGSVEMGCYHGGSMRSPPKNRQNQTSAFQLGGQS